MLNRAQIIGHLGRDPEVRYTQDGTPIANLAVATNETWKDASGAKQERTEWHRVVLFGKVAEIAREYLKKGGLAYLEGCLQTRKWAGEDGADRYTTEIVAERLRLLERRPEKPAGEPANGGPSTARAVSPGAELDDDIPF